MKLDFIGSLLTEAADAGPRIPHPEDAIFDGVAAAQKYLNGMKEVIAKPQTNTIKWDGFIALFFGYDPSGKFFISDKYMYPAGFYAHSPADWERYDTEIKSSKKARGDLYPKIAAIWEGLQAAVTARAVFKGDLMAIGTDQMTPRDGVFAFQNVTVTYKIPVDSAMGQAMKNKVAMIVVHSMNDKPWNGKTGLANKGNVAIIGPMGLPAGQASKPFTLDNPVQLVKTAEAMLKSKGPLAEKFLKGLDGVSQAKIKTYFNKKITGQTKENLDAWLVNPESNTKPPTVKKLVGDNRGGYLYREHAGYDALTKVWNAIYQLKNNLAAQLEPQVTGFAQEVNGQLQGEGFVANTKSAGTVKLVNRGVFGGAHFNK